MVLRYGKPIPNYDTTQWSRCRNDIPEEFPSSVTSTFSFLSLSLFPEHPADFTAGLSLQNYKTILQLSLVLLRSCTTKMAFYCFCFLLIRSTSWVWRMTRYGILTAESRRKNGHQLLPWTGLRNLFLERNNAELWYTDTLVVSPEFVLFHPYIVPFTSFFPTPPPLKRSWMGSLPGLPLCSFAIDSSYSSKTPGRVTGKRKLMPMSNGNAIHSKVRRYFVMLCDTLWYFLILREERIVIVLINTLSYYTNTHITDGLHSHVTFTWMSNLHHRLSFISYLNIP